MFSRAFSQLHVFTWSFDWCNGFSVSFVIGLLLVWFWFYNTEHARYATFWSGIPCIKYPTRHLHFVGAYRRLQTKVYTEKIHVTSRIFHGK